MKKQSRMLAAANFNVTRASGPCVRRSIFEDNIFNNSNTSRTDRRSVSRLQNPVLKMLFGLPLLLALGCQTVPAQPRHPIDPGVGLPSNRAPTDDEAVASDPCAIRLGHVVECMLQFYMLNKQMPQSLDQLQAFADVGSPLQLVCTASGQPYQYYPSGLMSAGRSKRIIVYDPTPAHHGNRWCIMMPYTAPGAAMSLEVVAVPEADFQTYVTGIQ